MEGVTNPMLLRPGYLKKGLFIEVRDPVTNKVISGTSYDSFVQEYVDALHEAWSKGWDDGGYDATIDLEE